MGVTNTSLLSIFVGGNDKADFPNIQGCAVSRNMITETNGEVKYLRSLQGKKFYRQIEQSVKNCTGSFYASVGLDAENRVPSSFWCFGSSVYELRPSGTVRKLFDGKLDYDYGFTFVESGGERPFLLICDGNNLYAYNLYKGDLQQVKMPLGITGDTIVPSSVSCLAGSIIVSDKNTGYAYYSQPYILSNDKMKIAKKDGDGNVVYKDKYTIDYEEASVLDGNIFYDSDGALQYKNAESSSDSIVCLKAVGDVLTVYGRCSIEFWTRSESEGMTWVRTNYTSNSSLGVRSARAVGVFNNVQGFLGCGNRNGFGIYTINGTEISKVSPTWLDEMMFESTLNAVFAYGYSYSNHSYYVVHFKDKNNLERSFAYDLVTGEWHERTSIDSTTGKTEASHYVYPIFNREGKLIYGGYRTKRYASLFEARKDYWYEDLNDEVKTSFVRSRQTPLIIDSERMFLINALSIEGNFGNCEDRTITPECMLEISRDGGYTYGSTVVRKLPLTGEYKKRVAWNNLGIARNCVIKFSTSSPIDLTISNASLTTVSLGYRF